MGSEEPAFGIYPEVALTLEPFYSAWIGPYVSTPVFALDLLFTTDAIMLRAHSAIHATTVHVGFLAPIGAQSPPYFYPFVGLAYNFGDQLRFGLNMATSGVWWIQADFIIKAW